MTHNRELPKDWHWTTIGAVCQINPPKPNLRGLLDKTTVLFVPMAAVDEASGQVSAAEARSLGEVRKKSYRTFTSGDVLFAKITPCMENGKSAVTPQIDTGLGFGSTEFHVIRTGPSIDRKYLWHFVRQETFRRKAEQNMTGSVGQLRVPKEFIERSPILLPPLEAQRALIENLDLVTAKRSSARLHLAAARRAIERFRQAVLAAACSGRLTADWREVHSSIEPASVLIERSVLSTNSQRQSFTHEVQLPDWLDIPPTWEWAPLGCLAEIRGGIQKQPKRMPKQNAFPYLRVANVLRGRLSLSEIHRFELFDGELETYRLIPGDLLIVEGNGSLSEIGRSAIWNGSIDNCVHQNHIIRVRSVEADSQFLDLVWNSPIGAREIAELAVTSSGLYSLSAGKIRAFAVPVPPLEEQREIVKRAMALLRQADTQLSRIMVILRQVEQSSQAVLAKAFRGELVPNGATSSDDLD